MQTGTFKQVVCTSINTGVFTYFSPISCEPFVFIEFLFLSVMSAGFLFGPKNVFSASICENPVTHCVIKCRKSLFHHNSKRHGASLFQINNFKRLTGNYSELVTLFFFRPFLLATARFSTSISFLSRIVAGYFQSFEVKNKTKKQKTAIYTLQLHCNRMSCAFSTSSCFL